MHLNKPFLLIALGILIAMSLQNTVAGFVNPILAPAKLSLS